MPSCAEYTISIVHGCHHCCRRHRHCCYQAAPATTATTIVELTVIHRQERKRQQQHYHQRINGSTNVKKFTSPNILVLFNLIYSV
jgi:hypothetical protein